MRILYFHQHFGTPRGSGGTRSYEFAKALVRRGHSVTMVCGMRANRGLDLPKAEGYSYYRGDVDGIDVIALPLEYSNKDSLLRRGYTFLSFAFWSALLAIKEDCDLVFATSTPLTAAIPGILAKVFRRKPFVFEVRDLWPELPKALGVKNPLLLGGMSLLEWVAYRSSTAAVGLSPGIVKGIKKRSRPELPVTMIPNGCDLDLFDSCSAPLAIDGVNDGDFLAGFTGAHGPANGLDSVIDAALALKLSGNQNIKFVFIGDGKSKPDLVDRAEREGLDNCLFLSPMPKLELARMMKSLDVGLMVLKDVPAFYFGTSPNKFFDYIAAGLPVLNNYPGWLASMVEESNCGVVVPPNDARQFAERLRALSEDSLVCRRMGESARALAKDRFSREDLSEEFCDWIELHAPERT